MPKQYKVQAKATIEYTVYVMAASLEIAEQKVRKNDFRVWDLGSPQPETVEIISSKETDEDA